jgi:hypothetical protein
LDLNNNKSLFLIDTTKYEKYTISPYLRSTSWDDIKNRYQSLKFDSEAKELDIPTKTESYIEVNTATFTPSPTLVEDLKENPISKFVVDKNIDVKESILDVIKGNSRNGGNGKFKTVTIFLIPFCFIFMLFLFLFCYATLLLLKRIILKKMFKSLKLFGYNYVLKGIKIKCTLFQLSSRYLLFYLRYNTYNKGCLSNYKTSKLFTYLNFYFVYPETNNKPFIEEFASSVFLKMSEYSSGNSLPPDQVTSKVVSEEKDYIDMERSGILEAEYVIFSYLCICALSILSGLTSSFLARRPLGNCCC